MVQNPVGQSEIKVIEKEVETTTFVNKILKRFSRKGKIEDHKINIKKKEDPAISQQKERRTPIQVEKR